MDLQAPVRAFYDSERAKFMEIYASPIFCVMEKDRCSLAYDGTVVGDARYPHDLSRVEMVLT
jgi:hypothetical protein